MFLFCHALNKHVLICKEKVKMDRNHGSTDLVHLTVGSIANYLHQLKDTCWVLEKKTTWSKKRKEKMIGDRSDVGQQVEQLSQIKRTELGSTGEQCTNWGCTIWSRNYILRLIWQIRHFDRNMIQDKRHNLNFLDAWGLYKTSMFSNIWRARFVGQDISEALQYNLFQFRFCT